MRLLSRLFFIILSCIYLVSCSKFGKHKEPKVCLSLQEMTLFNKINDYRLENGLEVIPLSASLSFVAKTHATDLSYNRPAYKDCNMHSWSTKGKSEWKPCCYKDDHEEKECMWNKPKELTNYHGEGYEICFGFAQFGVYRGDSATAQTAFEAWQLSSKHNDVILNKNEWKNAKWKAIGIGMDRDFACVWFGEEEDKEIRPSVCQ